MSFYMSARRVVQEMSFTSRDPLDPDVPPPASAPPPPPLPGDADYEEPLGLSYQHSQQQRQQQHLPDQLIPPPAPTNGKTLDNSSASSLRAAPRPAITHFDGNYEEDYSTSWLYHGNSGSGFGMLRGDADIQPNTGGKNSALGDGTALVEILWKLRWINIIASILAIMSEIVELIFKVFFHPAQAVLGGYLAFFSLMLLAYEARIPNLDKFSKENFGLLYHPLGRVFFLFLLSTLSLGQFTLMDILIGLVFLGNALYTLHTFIFYPEYRRLHEDEVQVQVNGSDATWWSRKSWTTPDSSTSIIVSTIAHGLMNEREALLQP